jgi:hypothetical protein
MVGPVITLDLWTAGGRKLRAPTIHEVRPVFENSQIPRLMVSGVLSDDGLPMSWTVKTRTHVDHVLLRVTVVLELSTEPLPTMQRVEPFDRPFNVLVVTDPRPGAVFSDQPYDVRIFSNNARELARTRLSLVPQGLPLAGNAHSG